MRLAGAEIATREFRPCSRAPLVLGSRIFPCATAWTAYRRSSSMRHGRHLKVMGKGTPALLGDVARVRSFLVRLVDRLGMRPLGEPIIHDVDIDLSKLGVEPFEDEGGVTGTLVLSTSHIALHTWPVRPFFVLDVYSCRDFEPTWVADELRTAFEVDSAKFVDVDVDYDG